MRSLTHRGSPILVLFLLIIFADCVRKDVTRDGRIKLRGETPLTLEGREFGDLLQTGTASWYGHPYHGRRTANGEQYNMHAPTAAHKTLPFGTWVRVVNQRNRKQAFVRINDRGPFVRGRIIDLSRKAAEDLDMIGSGTDVVSLYLTTKPKLQEPADTPTRTPTQGDWTIQVGSFSEYPRALRVAERFSEIDVRVRIEQFGALFRVRLGSFPSRQDAEHFSETLDLRDLDTWILDMNLERNKP